MPWVVRAVAYWRDQIPLLDSISAYYFTPGRDLFVGSLFAAGLFLAFYRGSDAGDGQDKLLGPVCGVAAMFIGLLPMNPLDDKFIKDHRCAGPLCDLNAGLVGYHFLPVAIFFATTIYLTLFRFTKPSQAGEGITEAKKRRNKVYVACGIGMLASVITIFFFDRANVSIFWPEAIAIGLFGIAWITKGRGLPGTR
jgi:hypothetical protein